MDWIQADQAIRVSRGEDQENLFFSAIQYVRGESFDIAIPYLRTIPMVLKDNEQVQVYVPSIGGMIMFQCRVMGSRFENIPLYVLSMPSDFVRIQQRNFVRYPCTLDILFAEKPSDNRPPVFSRTHTMDISGCGVSFLAGRSYSRGTPIIMKLFLPREDEPAEEIFLEGRVVRTWQAEQIGVVYLAAEFTEINARQQDLVVRYIFRKMSEAAHKQ